jgi:CubicO group peptidase (beta-lactamase class C family)
MDYLQDYDLSKVDACFRLAILEDLLTMRLGMEWYEIGAPMDNNTTENLEKSSDWVQFTLNQPMDTLPGTSWVYNSGASQLMSVILKKATGSHLDDFARENLFGPLEIEYFYWKQTPKGLPDALGGLYLKAEDLAKIGVLVLNQGNWEGNNLNVTGFDFDVPNDDFFFEQLKPYKVKDAKTGNPLDIIMLVHDLPK